MFFKKYLNHRSSAIDGPADSSRMAAIRRTRHPVFFTCACQWLLPCHWWLPLTSCVLLRRGELRGEQRRGGPALQVLHLQGILQEPHHHQVSPAHLCVQTDQTPPPLTTLPSSPPPGVATTSARPALCSTTASPNAATCATLRLTACSTPPKVSRWFHPEQPFRTAQLHNKFTSSFFYSLRSELIAKMEKRQALADQPPSEGDDNDD